MPVAERNAEREGHHGPVDFDILQSRNVARIHAAHHIKADFGDGQAGGAAEGRQQNTLGEQLPHQPLPAGAQSRPDGDLLLAPRRAREQQVRHIGAGDQQHQRHRPHQHEQGAAHVSHHLLLQADHVHAERLVALVLLADASGNHVDVRLRLPHRNSRLQAHQDVIVFVAPAFHGIGVQRQRQEDVHLVHWSFRRHHFRVEHESALQHAGHGELDSR